MHYPDDLLFLEPVNCTAAGLLDQFGNKNPTAIHNYINCLDRGWLGQAMRERYSFGNRPDIPSGTMLRNQITPDGQYKDWFKPIDEEIKDDVREVFGCYEPGIKPQLEVFEEALENKDDPGHELLEELVEMLREAYEIRTSILAAVTNSKGQRDGDYIDIPWPNGLEDVISRLSAKVLDAAIDKVSVKTFGRDYLVEFTMHTRNGEEAATQALLKELREWS